MAITQEQRDWLALTLVPGVGTAHFIRLLARYRTPGNVLRASAGSLRDVVGPVLAQRIAQYSEVAEVDAQVEAMERCDAQMITLEDAQYPLRLAEIYDPPLALFIRGDLLEQDQRCIAIVGTRRASPYGIRMAEKFGRELAMRGVTVVSGMASGIDTAAHRGAIEAGGRTIAVLGNGVDVVYPRDNADLMHAIMGHGCVMSQFPMGTKPSAGHFPYRNRIISGLCMGTLVVEAPLKSGALITARQAAEQGREVFAVPGEVGRLSSEGPHALIREGAKLVESADDILIELESSGDLGEPQFVEEPDPFEPEPAPAPPPRPAPKPRAQESPVRQPALAVTSTSTATMPEPPSPREQLVLSVLSPDGSYVDEIAAAARISVAEALSTLTFLELKGLVRQFSGKRFAPR